MEWRSRVKRHVLALGVAALAVALIVSGCARGDSPSDPSSEEPIRIGAVLSLTGPYAGLGAPEKNAIELEVAKINREGGINGRQIEVVIEDDNTDTGAAQAAVAKLVDQEGVVAVLGATGTGQSMAMRGDIVRAGVAQVSMAGGSVITDEFNEWVFQTPWPNRLVVPFTLDYLKSQNVKKLALISDSGGYGKDGVQVTLAAIESGDYGIEVVENQTFNAGDADMTAQLTKIKAAGPDGVLMWSAGSEAATILGNAKALGLEADMYGAPGNARKELTLGAAAAADGFEFAAGRILLPESYGSDTDAYRVATDFIDRYTAEYGTAPDIFAGHAYDALHITVEALRRIDGEVTPAAVRDEIEATTGLIGIGGTFTYTASDHNGLTESDLVMYRISGGDWTLAEGDN